MSQEIQLVPHNLPLQPAVTTPPFVLAPSGMPEATPLRRVHRLLRGRYALAAVLAAIGAACGVIAGLTLPKPSFKSIGLIQIHPVLEYPSERNEVMPLYIDYMANVMVKLHAERTIKEAMQSKEWKRLRPYPGEFPPADQIIDFGNHLDVRQVPAAQEMIQITYDDSRPDSRDVAQVAVRSIIDAYQQLWASTDMTEENNKKELILTNQKAALEQAIALNDRQIEALSPGVAGDPVLDQSEILVRAKDLADLEKSLKQAQQMLKLAEKEREMRRAGLKTGQNFTPEEIAVVNPQMADRLSKLADARIQVQEALSLYGPAHHVVQDRQRILDLREKDIRDATTQFNDRYFIETKQDGTSPVAVPKDLAKLSALVEQLSGEYRQEKEQIDKIRSNHATILRLREENQQNRAQITELNRVLRNLAFQKEMGGQFKVIEEGSLPQPSQDRRPVFAALGFLGGAALPVGMLLLIGLANPRYRFSDETGTDVTGLNLLGILPDLPDRLSDPEQASIAAHCVHQIRTMLQISGGVEEHRVFAITSAAPGDGKTSLTLALGLSYAACGTRTLLIDCDLVGAGLTTRMNVNTAEGVLEAIANRSLADYVRSTDVADVSILPVGSAQTLHASTLSPAALRRLIDEARKQFDTILIDTGPILGSIEASLVCAAADAVVLTVARGQQRPLVEKAIGHLMSIGAKLAGVVFNRAQANDFDRSISGASSLRSAGAGTGHNAAEGPRYGTLGRAVHSHTQPDLNEG